MYGFLAVVHPPPDGTCTGCSAKGVDFGILPGGTDEVAPLSRHRRRERVYPSRRVLAFFQVRPATRLRGTARTKYTFGEVDLYRALEAGDVGTDVDARTIRDSSFPSFGVRIWYAPWSPRSDVAAHTVLGGALGNYPRSRNPRSSKWPTSLDATKRPCANCLARTRRDLAMGIVDWKFWKRRERFSVHEFCSHKRCSPYGSRS